MGQSVFNAVSYLVRLCGCPPLSKVRGLMAFTPDMVAEGKQRPQVQQIQDLGLGLGEGVQTIPLGLEGWHNQGQLLLLLLLLMEAAGAPMISIFSRRWEQKILKALKDWKEKNLNICIYVFSHLVVSWVPVESV